MIYFTSTHTLSLTIIPWSVSRKSHRRDSLPMSGLFQHSYPRKNLFDFLTPPHTSTYTSVFASLPPGWFLIQLKMTLSVVQLFYLLAVFWQNSSQALPVLYPESSGQNWLQSLISQKAIAETANYLFSSLQSRQGMPNEFCI